MEMSDQYTLTMGVISLVLRGNWGRLMKKWMMIKYNLLCKSMAEIGLSGIRILHLQATWVVYGRDKSYHPEQYYHLYWKHMGKVWKMSLSLHSWQWRKICWTPDTVETINDTTSFQPLSPINLLTMKSKVVSSPPGNFWTLMFIACKRRWRHIQCIANKFSSPWRRVFTVTSRTSKMDKQKKKL